MLKFTPLFLCVKLLAEKGIYYNSCKNLFFIGMWECKIFIWSIQNVLKKVTPEDAPKISDQIMTALLHMFSSYSGENGGVQEDAMMAVTTLVQVLGEGFIKYMESFKPFLFAALKNHAEYQVILMSFIFCL